MFGIPNPSPFCMKLETWLRMTRIPFEIVRVVDPRKGPKGKVPWIEDQVGRLVRRTIAKSLHLQGLGRHSQEDLYRLACDDLTALAEFLGDQPYFFGDKPTELDATAYGFLAQVLWAPGPRRLREHMAETRNLPAFCERIKRAFYGGNES
jgi:glutathione S-transferase